MTGRCSGKAIAQAPNPSENPAIPQTRTRFLTGNPENPGNQISANPKAPVRLAILAILSKRIKAFPGSTTA
jgi:hypothetical protein